MTRPSALRLGYLAAACLATVAVLPDWGLTVWAPAIGPNSGPLSGPSAALVCAGLAALLWVLAEVTVRRNWIALVVLPLGLLLGLGPALPLYLFLRTRKIS